MSDGCVPPMIQPAGKPVLPNSSNEKNSLAPDPATAVPFTLYTQRVWSKVAGRPITPAEAEQIVEDFGRLLRALASSDGDQP